MAKITDECKGLEVTKIVSLFIIYTWSFHDFVKIDLQTSFLFLSESIDTPGR